MKARVIFLSFCLCIYLPNASIAQDAGGLASIGIVRPLNASEIVKSRWSIGGETLDRGYTSYSAYKSYLGALGAKRLRLQAGWARCERVKGQYDFAWLDTIVNDAVSQSVHPWLQLSYGNPVYAGGGDAALAGGLPTSNEALTAWDKWATALVNHFKDRVTEWEIWNEPDLSSKFTAKDYARFYERTAELVRREQPQSRLIGLALCCSGWLEYARTFTEHLTQVNKIGLIDIISFHGYQVIPENTYPEVDKLKAIILAANSKAEFWQGENGAPSVKKGESVGAMNDHDWSELTQAKWNLRRMLGDMGHDVAVTNIFQISDMYYGSTDHMKGYNAKGLLKANPDRTIAGPKMAYKAYQFTASVFSGVINRIRGASFQAPPGYATYGYRKDIKKGSFITLWKSDAAPVDSTNNFRKIRVTVKNVRMNNPVYINLLTGKVYALPRGSFKMTDKSTLQLNDIPVPDYPVVIADRSLIILNK